jgi:hypothetical protein
MQSNMKAIAKFRRRSLFHWPHKITFWLMICNYALAYIKVCCEGGSGNPIMESHFALKLRLLYIPPSLVESYPCGHTHHPHFILNPPPMAIQNPPIPCWLLSPWPYTTTLPPTLLNPHPWPFYPLPPRLLPCWSFPPWPHIATSSRVESSRSKVCFKGLVCQPP